MGVMFLNIYWDFLGGERNILHVFTVTITFIHVDITLLLARNSSYLTCLKKQLFYSVVLLLSWEFL
jgi:hypothetical protein